MLEKCLLPGHMCLAGETLYVADLQHFGTVTDTGNLVEVAVGSLAAVAEVDFGSSAGMTAEKLVVAVVDMAEAHMLEIHIPHLLLHSLYVVGKDGHDLSYFDIYLWRSYLC